MFSPDAIFSSFTGEDAPLAFVYHARAVFRRTSFRDFDLDEEIFDVSGASGVRLEDCTFTNITVPDNEYVSTSYSDYDYFRGSDLEVEYYPEDDGGPLFDIIRWRANVSDIPDVGVQSIPTVLCSQSSLFFSGLMCVKHQGKQFSIVRVLVCMGTHRSTTFLLLQLCRPAQTFCCVCTTLVVMQM